MKNSFPVPNKIFDLNLCAEEIAIYLYLIRRANRQTGQCFPSFKTIGSAVKKTKNTVAKYVKSLEEKEFIYTENTQVPYNSKGYLRNGNLMYMILSVDDAYKHMLYLQQKENEKRCLEAQLRQREEERKCGFVQEEFDMEGRS